MEEKKIMKKFLLFFTALAVVFTLAACGDGTDPVDEDIVVTLAGVEDFTVTEDDVVNVLDGITASGDDGNDYSSLVTADSDDCTLTDGVLDTSVPGSCIITYSVVVDGKFVRDNLTITIEAKPIEGVSDTVLKSWNFDDAAQLEGWNIYTAGGGAIDMSVEDGAMKLVTASGGQRFETRLDFQGLPLEQGYPYTMTFRMKSDIDGKKVHINFGELLPSDPWFTPFKPENVDIITLSTDWQEFTISFNMELDNQNGGPLFEMGNMEGSEGLDATIWVDDFVITGGSGEDTIDPVIEGAGPLTIYVEEGLTEFDPLEGVTATDYPDVDLTTDLVVSGDVVDPTTPGTYMVYYVVFDSAFNSDRVDRVITVLSDTEAPVLSGVEDATVIVGENFDPLAGVMAMDGKDGDVSADIVLSGDTYEEVEGTYTITYTVEDELGNSVTVDRVVTVLDLTFVDSEELINGSFDAGYWNPYWESWNGADAFFSTSDDGLVIDIKAVGGDFWHVLIEQPGGGISMEAGKTYRLTFDAMSSVARDIQVEVAGAGLDPAQETVSLTDTMTTFTVDFTSATAVTGQLKFLMGLVNGAGASVITLDNVMFEEWDGAAIVADTDQVMDGSFDEWQNIGWGVWSPNDNTAFQVQWQEAWVTYTEANANPWENKLEQLNLAMDSGLYYRVTFKAKGDVARDAIVGFWDGGTAFEYSFELGTEFQEYTWIFKYTGGPTAALEFKLGQSSDNFAGTLFIVDDVMIEVEDAIPPGPTTLDNLANQDFTDADISAWGTEGTLTLSHDAMGYLVASVTELGANPWDQNIGAANLFVHEGYTYTVAFVVKTAFPEGRDVTFFAENTDAGYAKYFEQTATLTDAFQTFTYSFTPDADNTDTKLGLFLGNTSNPLIGDVVIDSITITVEEPFLTLADMPNQDFTDADISGWSTQGTLTLAHDAAGYLVASVTELGANPWDQNFGFGMQNVVAGKVYTVSYTVKTAFPEGRDVTFFVENVDAGYAKYFEETVTLTDSFQTFTYSFTADADNNDTNLGMFVGNTSNPLIGDVVVDSIIVTEVDAPAWASYGVDAVDTAGVVALTYTSIPDPWYNANAQYQNMIFDGTNDALEFTITGTVGHTYVFKLEGGANAPVEVEILADGTEQVLVMDLSGLTEAQRAEFSLLVVFVKDPGVSGSATLEVAQIVQPS
jgi:hypothetical protein